MKYVTPEVEILLLNADVLTAAAPSSADGELPEEEI